MKITDIKIGQKVRRLNYDHGTVKVGDIYEVVEIILHKNEVILSNSSKYKHSADNLELVSLTQTNMTYLKQLTEDMVGQRVQATIEGKLITDAKLQLRGGKWYFCNDIKDGGHSYVDRLGYKYGWCLGSKTEDMLRHKISLIDIAAEIAPVTASVSIKETDLVKDEIYVYNTTHIFMSDRTGGEARASHYVGIKDKYYGTSSGISKGTYRLATRAERLHLYVCMDAKKYADPPVLNKFIPGDKVIITEDTGNYYDYFGDKLTVHGASPVCPQEGLVIKERDKVCLVQYTAQNKLMLLGFHEDTLKHAESLTLPTSITDVSNTKIWVGKDASLREKVLQRLKELGCTNTDLSDFKESVSFYIDNQKHVRHSTSDNQSKKKDGYFNEEKSKKEIFPMDLGIIPEGGLPDMDPEMLVQMIING